ncbi:host attachment protein [Desulfonatronospira sp.]|uniref:host attachment protein n=1 Tax=Desulfonatronospira sp. TaxID=1962951 RepID=UPI0025B85031|nr:host attachment protein [Desulfonatronospira sp.]
MDYKAWVVVADSSQARIFGANARGGGLTELEKFEHPESRMRDQDLKSDKAGRMYSMQGEFRTAVEQTPGRKLEAERFAQKIAEHLEKSLHNNKYERLVLAASPSFLGMLRNNLNDNARKALSNELDKDLCRIEKPEEIRKRLPEYLW